MVALATNVSSNIGNIRAAIRVADSGTAFAPTRYPGPLQNAEILDELTGALVEIWDRLCKRLASWSEHQRISFLKTAAGPPET
ncbi:MAG: hypothetical protein ABIW58_05470 [Sphingomicrobium sp.]